MGDARNADSGGRDALLFELERRQRAEAPAPEAATYREQTRVRIPAGGSLPESAAWLERLYEGDLVPREKKEPVIDTRRCGGPYLVSVDAQPLTLLDACAQIATLTHGFAHPAVLKALHEGDLNDSLWSNLDTRFEASEVLERYAAGLVARAPEGLEHVAFVTAGGAEANEKAFRIARANAPRSDKRKRVLAFENGFHGRTWVSLGATWNPAKRGPFELEGYEAVFCPPDLEALAAVLADRNEEIYAAILEPMMAEGGDVHLTREFVAGVRKLTRDYGIPLIADEVQTGFFTGGPFFWWTRLGLGDTPETAPDLLTCAKKSGIGLVLSRWPDPEPSAVNVISAARGLVHLESAGEQGYLEAALSSRLEELAGTFPHLVGEPRVAGTTFAFDLPDAAAVDRFIEQRFQRGFMTYQAGPRAIRFRLSASWTDAQLDDLFARIAKALVMLDDPARTEWVEEGTRAFADEGIVVRELREEDWPAIEALQAEAYEPERRDGEDKLRKVAAEGLGLVATDGEGGPVVGCCFGGPIENFSYVVGPDRDRWAAAPGAGGGKGGVAFYSADLTVAEAARGRGVGRLLKQAQLDWAAAHGFRFATSRNRVNAAESMSALNRALGGYEVARFEGEYGGKGTAAYYRVPLGAPPTPAAPKSTPLDLAAGLQRPFGVHPDFMATRELQGPVASRLNLSNWATPDVVHYAEHLRCILPRGTSHLYFTSSRDELVDKALRCLRMSRPAAQYALSLEGGYFGHVTAAARAVSDPAGFGPDFDLLDWPRLPHPAVAGIDATLAALDEVIEARGGAERAFALMIESFGERSGLGLSDADLLALSRACKRWDLPLVVSETTTGGYRNAQAPWAVDGWPSEVLADMILWYPGGQLGHIFVNDRYYISKPLMLISTWDGDEVSLIRTHEALRAAWKLDFEAAEASLRSLAEALAQALGGQADGRGLYWALRTTPAKAAAFLAAVDAETYAVQGGAPGVITLVPALDVEAEALDAAREDLLAVAKGLDEA